MISRFILRLLWCCLLYHGASGVDTDRVSLSVMEGESVTLHTGVKTNQQVSIKWYLYDTLIAQITGDQSKICSDVQCNEGTERFRDRLKLDHQTGSLTIMNTRTTDSGECKLQMNISRFSIVRNFTFLVASPPSTAGAGTNATGIAGVVGAVVVLLIAAVSVVIYYCRKRCTKPKQEETTGQDNPREENGEAQRFLPEQNYIEMNDVSGTTTD